MKHPSKQPTVLVRVSVGGTVKEVQVAGPLVAFGQKKGEGK